MRGEGAMSSEGGGTYWRVAPSSPFVAVGTGVTSSSLSVLIVVRSCCHSLLESWPVVHMGGFHVCSLSFAGRCVLCTSLLLLLGTFCVVLGSCSRF